MLGSAVAVLLIVPHDAAVVGDEICTVRDAPEANVPKSHDNTPAAIEHCAAPVPPSIAHAKPASAGSVSVKLTPVA